MKYTFTQGKPNHENEPIEIFPDTILTLPETLSFPSTPSVTGLTP